MVGVRCVAAPIGIRDGAVVASIGISAPSARFPRKRSVTSQTGWWWLPRRVGEIIGYLKD